MAYIIANRALGRKTTACVDVCPVDCIHPRKDEPEFATAEMLYIHPDECIDCGACVPACPVEAIFALDETPDKWKHFIPMNAEYFQKQACEVQASSFQSPAAQSDRIARLKAFGQLGSWELALGAYRSEVPWA